MTRVTWILGLPVQSPGASRSSNRVPAVMLAGLVTLAMLGGSCSRKPAASGHGQAAGVPVLASPVVARDMPVEIGAIGNVEAYSTVTVRSQITGQLNQVHFQEGQEVRKGDLLFTIDRRPAEAALNQARANLERDEALLTSARLEFERVKTLLESSIASRNDYDKAEAAFQSLQGTIMADRAAIANAELDLEYTAIRSPLDGRTGAALVKAGNIVKSEEDELVTIRQTHPVYATFSVPEQELPEIRRRMREAVLQVEVTVPGETGSQQGELAFVDNAVDATTGTVRLKATFRNDDNSLWPGQFVRVKLTLSTLREALVVPSQAVQTSQSGEFVYVVKADNTVEKRPVATDFSREGFTVVRGGLNPGETVVTDGQLRLAPGSKVTLRKPEDDTAAARQASPAQLP